MVDAAFLIENPERGGEPLRQVVDSGGVEAFVIDTVDAQNDSDIPALGEEDFLVHKAEQIHLRAKRGCFAVFLSDSVELKHGGASALARARTSSGRTACESSWSSARTAGFGGRCGSPLARRDIPRKPFPHPPPAYCPTLLPIPPSLLRRR